MAVTFSDVMMVLMMICAFGNMVVSAFDKPTRWSEPSMWASIGLLWMHLIWP